MAEKVKALTKKQLETLKLKLVEEKNSLVFNEQEVATDIELSKPEGRDGV